MSRPRVRSADSLTLQFAASVAQLGDALVLDTMAFVETAPRGDLLTTYARQVGIAELALGGAGRDAGDIVELGFPALRRGISIEGTEKRQLGRINDLITPAEG